MKKFIVRVPLLLVFLIFISFAAVGQTPTATPKPPPTHADILRGEWGPFRANNDLLSYYLDIRIDPDKKMITGKNTVTFKMLKDDKRIQLDLYDNLNIDKITMGKESLKYERDSGAVFVDFPQALRANKTYSIDFYY